MIQMTLRWRYSEQPLRSATAVYLPGGDPDQWLQEIAQWKVAHSALRLYPLPASRHSLAPVGVLVASAAAVEWQQLDIHRGIPFGSVSPRLFLPIDAALDPPLAAEELDQLLEPDRTYVWHPAIGLVVFERPEVLRVTDLLEPPPSNRSVYDFAQPGIIFAKHLVGLTAEQTPSFIQILIDAQDGIGLQSDELLDLPPSPQEPSQNPVRRLGNRSLATLAGVIRSLTEQVPATGKSPTWINSLENWANRHLANFQQGRQADRHKEISRLLNLLANDPDQGLRYAIPLAARGPRGLASSGSSLQKRDVDFDLKQLGGGKPADGWNLSNGFYESLQRRYRELANREIQLGRHRRAAYIFAHLLADDAAAANTLRTGRHYREAAVLYRDRLNRPLDAAICLEQGGLLTEAAELLELLGEHERLGNLLRQLEQDDAADAAYRRAVEQHRTRGEFIQAAELCELKLNAPDEALAELQRGWPDSAQNMLCLQQMFQIWGRHGRHATARNWVEQLRDGRYPVVRAPAVAELLAELSNAYPDQSTQQRAADATRHVVARRLRSAPPAELQPLLRALTRLAPEDRLLSRDCRRYEQQRTQPQRKIGASSSSGKIHLVKRVQLDALVTWQQAIVAEDSIFAAGFKGRHLILGRCNRDGTSDEYAALKAFDHQYTTAPILLHQTRGLRPGLLLHVVGSDPIVPQRLFAGASVSISQGLLAGGIYGLSAQVITAACGPAGITWVIEERDRQFILIALQPNGELLSSHLLPLQGHSGCVPKLAIHDGHISIAVGNCVYAFYKNELQLRLELPHRIESIVTPLPHTRNRLAATFATGGLLIWPHFDGVMFNTFATEMDTPLVGFNQSFLIAVNETTCEVCRTQAGNIIALKGRLETPRCRPVAILPAVHANQFIVLTEDGELNIWLFRRICG